MSGDGTNWRHVYVVYRIDHFLTEVSGGREHPSITIKEVLPTADEAEREVARLAQLRTSDESTYLWQSAKLYPDGRGLYEGED